MRGSIQINGVVLLVMISMLVAALAALTMFSVMEEPFITKDACAGQGGTMCEKGEICPKDSLGVVKEGGDFGKCCPVKCVRD